MNNKKIVNLANPVDNEDAANKKWVDEKRKQLIYSLFCQNMQKEVSHGDIHQRKSNHAGIIQTKTHTAKYLSKSTLCHCCRSIRIVQSCNTKRKISRRPRISTSKNSERHFFSFSKDSLRSPYQIVLFFSASSLFCYLESKQMILETSKKQFEISFDWK